VDPDEFIQFCRTRGRACDNDNMRIFAETYPMGIESKTAHPTWRDKPPRGSLTV